MSSVDITLGKEEELGKLFSLTGTESYELNDALAHVFNQTLQRDMYFGSWAESYFHEQDGKYHLKLTSPDKDLSLYETTIPKMLSAMKLAVRIYGDLMVDSPKLKFYLPFGLSMAAYKAVQLLHFPPSEAMQFRDYLYNPTCRRWELLLLHNGFDGRENTLLERLIDLVPFAAPGGDASDIDNYNATFEKYVITMLELFLSANARDGLTAPAVVGGAPAIECIGRHYGNQLPEKESLNAMSLVTLEIVKGKKTHLLCTNHPSTYLYYEYGSRTEPPNPAKAEQTMQEDLICAGWQAKMAGDWTLDPAEVLDEMKDRWHSGNKVKAVMKESGPEWSFSK